MSTIVRSALILMISGLMSCEPIEFDMGGWDFSGSGPGVCCGPSGPLTASVRGEWAGQVHGTSSGIDLDGVLHVTLEQRNGGDLSGRWSLSASLNDGGGITDITDTGTLTGSIGLGWINPSVTITMTSDVCPNHQSPWAGSLNSDPLLIVLAGHVDILDAACAEALSYAMELRLAQVVTVGSVEVTPAAGSVSEGDTLRLVAVARDEAGNVIPSIQGFTWSSSDSTLASVSESGLVRAVSPGVANITATTEGKSGQSTITIIPTVTGRIDDAQTVADLLAYHQEAIGGLSYRKPGVIARWELPIPVYVDSSASIENVRQALDYWQSVTGLPYVILKSNAEPRILVRAGSDGLGEATGRGLLDGAYTNGQARSGLVVLRPDRAQCDLLDGDCALLYKQLLGSAIGIFAPMPGGGISSGGPEASAREINLLVELYRLPHGAHIAPDGSWRVAP